MKIRETIKPDGSHVGWIFWCPGCKAPHSYRDGPIDPECPQEPRWTFDGNLELPSFEPSLLNHEVADCGRPRCHLFLRKGQLDFCTDSGHALAGKSVPLTDWPWPTGEFGGIKDG